MVHKPRTALARKPRAKRKANGNAPRGERRAVGGSRVAS